MRDLDTNDLGEVELSAEFSIEDAQGEAPEWRLALPTPTYEPEYRLAA
jgi:hypothetical protein